METVLKKISPAQAFFFSKADNIKIERNVCLFFPHSLIFLFMLFSIFFIIAWSDFEAFKSREIKVCTGQLVQRNVFFFDTVLIKLTQSYIQRVTWHWLGRHSGLIIRALHTSLSAGSCCVLHQDTLMVSLSTLEYK